MEGLLLFIDEFRDEVFKTALSEFVIVLVLWIVHLSSSLTVIMTLMAFWTMVFCYDWRRV